MRFCKISPDPSLKRGDYFFCGNIRVKIKRVKVEELRRKSTKGRKWEILSPLGL
jgi:hypothetical protein